MGKMNESVKEGREAKGDYKAATREQEDRKEVLRQVAHEVDAAVGRALGEETTSWEKADKAAAGRVTDQVEYLVGNSATSAEDLHADWMRKRTEEGYAWGEEEGEGVHPNFLPWDQLPPPERIRLEVVVAAVKTLNELL